MLDKVGQTSAAVAVAGELPIRFSGAGYRVGAVSILCGIDLELAAGPPTVLLGPNGSGKTTLLKLAMGLFAPTTGGITFAGRSTPAAGRRAIVFQKPVMLRRSAAANVAYAMTAAGRPAERSEVARLIAEVGLGGLGDRPARRMSGGEQQRLALARALARDPEVLFLDEPTASLDPASTKAVEDIIARVAGAGVKIVMSTHDLGQARRLAGEVVFLAKGRLIEKAAAPGFFASPSTDEARRFLAGELVL
ncbi:MAG: ATP-binding cassette domain-containing protein [Hyphomicrobiaceae bacterium]|nr:ATP-binding cassette domain-containing protein [Hyphomicrobiaceae bacterium]